MISRTVSKWKLEAFFSSTGKSECLYPSCFFISDFSFKFLRPSWWPCDFSPLTVVFTALWPLITHWLVHLYLQRKRRWEKKVPHILRKWLFLFYDHNKTQLKFSFCFSPHSKIPWIVYYYWQLSTSIKEDELWMKTMHFLGVLWLSWAKLRCRVQWGIGRNLKGCFRWTNGWKLGNVV